MQFINFQVLQVRAVPAKAELFFQAIMLSAKTELFLQVRAVPVLLVLFLWVMLPVLLVLVLYLRRLWPGSLHLPLLLPLP